MKNGTKPKGEDESPTEVKTFTETARKLFKVRKDEIKDSPSEPEK
jgi:hypothetical protein